MNRLFTLISVTGPDAVAFLQGQLTQDVRRLETAHGLPAAWCNAGGRVIAFMRLCAFDDHGIGLVVPRASADDLLRRLSMYRLRSRVELAAADVGWRAVATRRAEDHQALDSHGLLPERGPLTCRSGRGLVVFDTGAAERCVEIYGAGPALAAADLPLRDTLDDSGWQAALIDAGVPHIVAPASEKFTAHMLNLDALGAISFQKGCYTGQEVVARTEHLGRSKRRLLRYDLAGGTAAPGDKLKSDRDEIGEIVNVIRSGLLAVVTLARRHEALRVHGHAVQPVELPYAVPLANETPGP